MSDITTLIWAYLHDELSPESRNHFESALEDSPSLRKALEEQRATHEELKSILPLIEAETANDEQQEEQLIAEWEAEHPEFAEPPQQQKSQGRIMRFAIPLAVAAAACVVLLALPGHQGPVYWQNTLYGTAPQLRGESAAHPRYNQTELEQVSRQLQNIIEDHIARLPDSAEPWKLKIHLQELAGGYLAVEVSGHPANRPKRSRTWDATFQGKDRFDAEASGFGKRIANDLAEQDVP